MSQPQPQLPPASTGLFIVGIVAGFLAGGTLLTILALLIGVAIAQVLSHVTSNSNLVAFAFCYGIALAAGVLAFILVRRNVGFLSGFVVGVTAGLLGGVTLCNGVIGGLSNMH